MRTPGDDDTAPLAPPALPPDPRTRHRRGILGAVVAVLVVGGLAGAGHAVLRQAVATFGHLDWTWILPAVLAEAASMGAFARMQRHLFRVTGVPMRLRSTLAVTYAANAVSLSLPVAGPAASVGYAYLQFRRHGADAAATSWTLGVSWVVSTSTLGVVLAAGAVASGNPTALAVGLAGAVVAVVPLVAVVVALRNGRARTAIRRLTVSAWAAAGRARRRPAREWEAALPVDAFLEELSTVSMPASGYLHVGALSSWNWIANALCLVCAILATGGDVPWHGLLLAYAVGTGAAFLPLTPGGVGVVEAALAAALVVAGMHGPHALAAVLVFRIVSFWLVVAVGWVVVAVLSRADRARAPA